MPTVVEMLLHRKLTPEQLAQVRKHRHVISAHNTTTDEHAPQGLLMIAVGDDKVAVPYALNVLFIALGPQPEPQLRTIELPEGRIPFKPDWTVSPGETIQEVLDELGITPLRLAERAHLSVSHVHRLLEGRCTIDADTAVRLEHTLGIKAEFWLSTDARHQLHHVRRAHDRRGCTCSSVRPVSDTKQVTP